MSSNFAPAAEGGAPLPVLARPERPRLAYLDGLRALAALYVVWHHSWQSVSGASDLRRYLGWQQVAVDLFIVLSGFSLMLPVVMGDGTLRGGALGFYKRRFRRIIPPYYWSMALSLLLIVTLVGRPTGTHWDISIPVTWPDVVLHLALLQNIIWNTKINHAYWTIAVESQIYLMFPLLVLGWRRWGGLRLTLACVAVACGVFVAVLHTAYAFCSLWYIALFELGMLAAALAHSPNGSYQAWGRWRGWGAVAVGGLVAIKFLDQMKNQLFAPLALVEDLAVGATAGALLIYLSNTPDSLPRRFLSSRPMVFIGTFAYSIYLIHAPLVQVVWQYIVHPLRLRPHAEFAVLLAVGTPIIVAVSYLFFLGCERPWLVRRKNETPAEVARDAAMSPAP